MPLIDMSETYQMTNVGDHIDGTDVYQSNRNLLDNAYFVGGGSQLGDGVFPINQRGQTTYSTAAWNMDRWYGACTLYSNYLHIPSFIEQNASYPLNTPLTMSAMLEDGTIVSGTATFSDRTTQQYFYTDGVNIQLVRAADGMVMIWTGVGVNVKAAKLEVGTVSTLANDPPPDFGEELRKCQRYLWCKTFTQYTQIGVGVATDANNCVVDVVLPASMRTGATITFTANVLLIGAGGAIVGASVSAINIIDNHARLNVVAASSMVTHNTYSFITSAETTMTISAEL